MKLRTVLLSNVRADTGVLSQDVALRTAETIRSTNPAITVAVYRRFVDKLV